MASVYLFGANDFVTLTNCLLVLLSPSFPFADRVGVLYIKCA